MITGFNLKIGNKDEFSKYYALGEAVWGKTKGKIEQTLQKYTGPEGVLDGSRVQADWFPDIRADVFLSHSHRDERLAIAFAGWLHEKMGIDAFIDSCVWGYADELLKQVDEAYCRNPTRNGIETYNYEMRNLSTTHVHMMLNVALQKMICKSKCLFFLNTENSARLSRFVQGEATMSPWIYAELSFFHVLLEQQIEWARRKRLVLDEAKTLPIEYSLPEMKTLTKDDMNDWAELVEKCKLKSADMKIEALSELCK